MKRRFFCSTLFFITPLLILACNGPSDPGSNFSSGSVTPPLFAHSVKSLLTLSVIEPADPKRATALGQYLVWLVQIDRNGEPFPVNAISIDGGMPAHGHGLPTQPRVTAQVSEGRYRVEGLKFTMPGRWILNFTVSSKLGNDRFSLEIDVGH
ncbi:MAG: FixH family protein [Gammaproteobacteria bacterium]|nr:FixH family protein [Gammaproteobacteria bacterium]NND39987.1 FixH family protein [Pseudomonadales bacterium]MBT8151560.1 FixH family protein [Gammaproteobacteria bacterium]NNL10716.1 FixH family protein [Pseudomonadales bacterium]NNM10984.1 FixH family protein [Pseudomonadales bacterium]